MHIQGRAQRKDAQALAVRPQGQVQPFIGQVHRAIDIQDGVIRVDDELARAHQSLVDGEIGGHAVQLDLLVARQFGQHDAADIQAHFFQQQLADAAPVDQRAHFAVRAAQQGGDGIARGR
ncbi:hypothetical protein D3C72_1675550 [compost metagenome]